MSNDPQLRYSDAELQEFKELIESKLAKALEESEFTDRQIQELNEYGFNQQGGDMYDDSSSHADLEMLQRMSQRQKRHIQDLSNALLRIQNKTYGICTVTGKLIDKQRLRLVPHATKSVDGKNMAKTERPEVPTEAATYRDPFLQVEDEGNVKPVSERVRGAQPKAPRNADDWEPDNDAIDDAAYNLRKLEEEED